jgi:hypothetical protein
MKAFSGITLLELVMASVLMGLLFCSGLQLLGTLFQVQSVILKPGTQGADGNFIYLQAFLRSRLQGITNLEISEEGKSLHYNQTSWLSFRKNPDCPKWELVYEEEGYEAQTLFQWKNVTAENLVFTRDADNSSLLTIHLGQEAPALSIWLRNLS